MKRMITMITVFIMILGLSSNVFAEEELPKAGTTPDDFFYFLDVFFDDIKVRLASSPDEKIARGIEVADERLAEIQAMSETKDIKGIQKAQEQHNKTLERIKLRFQEITDKNSSEELKRNIEIESKFNEHKIKIKSVNENIKIKIKGDINQEAIDNIIKRLENSSMEIEVEIKQKKDEIRIKIKSEGKDIEKIEKEIAKIDKPEFKVRAKTENGKSLIKVELKYETTKTGEELVNEIQDKFDLTYNESDNLLKTESGIIDGTDRLKIEVKNDDGINEVKVELRFLLESDDRDSIVSEIEKRTVIDPDKIRQAVNNEKFREGKDDDDDMDNDEFEKNETMKDDEDIKEIDDDEVLEIEVEIEDGSSTIEIQEVGKNKDKFKVPITDQEKLIQVISDRINKTNDEIKSVIEIKVK